MIKLYDLLHPHPKIVRWIVLARQKVFGAKWEGNTTVAPDWTTEQKAGEVCVWIYVKIKNEARPCKIQNGR